MERGMRRGLNSLASIAAVAPFFGFFGTALGILNSFRSIGASRSTAMAATADYISQALAPTILGLFVALGRLRLFSLSRPAS